MRPVVATVLLCAAAGCTAPRGEGPAASTAWCAAFAPSLDGDGRADEVVVPWNGTDQGVALRVEAGDGRCFQVDSMTDEAGHVFIAPGDLGATCRACEQRSSAGAGSALFVFPSRGGPFAPAGSLRVRFGLRDCATWGSFTGGGATAPAPLRVRAEALAPPPPDALLHLHVVVTPASIFYAPADEGDARLAAARDALQEALAPARIRVAMTVSRAPPGSASDATFGPGEYGALAALRGGGDAGPGVTAVLAGCLRYQDAVLGVNGEPEGFTPHIPGGAGDSDAVFVRGALCGTPNLVRVDWAAPALARVLAHEVGHYLGLYHSVEQDGTTDQLDDTGADNAMYFRPSQAGATGWSPSQGALMRRHPALAPPICP